MKRRGGRRVYEQIKGMTAEEELAFWRDRSASLDHRIDAARQKASKPRQE